MIILLINFRDFLINIFKKKIIVVEKNNIIIKNKFIIFFLNLFYFFFIKDLLKINKINTIYEIDDLKFYDENNINKLIINHIILNCVLVDPNNDNDNNNIEITEKINKYSKQIPIYIILEIENIDIKNNIRFNLLYYNKTKIVYYDIKSIINKRLYEIIK